MLIHEYDEFPHQFTGHTEGQCFKEARAKGWLIGKERQLCPKCSGKKRKHKCPMKKKVEIVPARCFIRDGDGYRRVEMQLVCTSKNDDGSVLLEFLGDRLATDIDWNMPRRLYVVYQECDDPDTPPDFQEGVFMQLDGFKHVWGHIFSADSLTLLTD
jgi:hypothetical protein